MAFNEQEQAIIKWGTENGKSTQEIKDAIFRLRTTGSAKAPAEEKPQVGIVKRVVADIPSDIVETGAGIARQFGTAGEEIVGTIEDKKLTPFQKIIQGGAQAFRGAARAFGEGVIGLGKTFVTPEAEEKVAEVVKTGAEVVAAQPVVQDLLQRYESLDPDTKRNIDNALGYTEGLAEIITGGVAGRVVRPAIEATSRATKVATGQMSKFAAETADQLSGITATGVDGVRQATNSLLDPAQIMQRVARVSKGKQAAFEQRAGKSVGQYLVDNGIFGDVDEITTQLFDRFQKSRTAADEALSRLDERFPQTYKTKPVETALNELFARETRVSTPGAPSRDFARVRDLKRKYDTDGLTMTEINELKRIYERNVRVDYLKTQNPEGVARATNIDSALREWQFEQAKKLGLTNLPDINRETMLAKQLLDDLGKEYAGSAGNNAVTLTDWIILSGLDPSAIGAFVAKKSFSNKSIQSAIAKRLAGKPTTPDSFPIFENSAEAIESYGDWIRSIEGKTTQ